MGRSALITGGSGFIATRLAPALVEAGWRVRACGRSPRPDSLPDEADYRNADLASGEGVDELFDGITHVFHLAGASSSNSTDEEMHRSNAVGTENLLSAGADAGFERFLYMSTTAIYGEEVQLPVPVLESVEPHPSRGYGKTKWEAEQVVARFGEKGVPVVTLRPVSTYGPANVKLLGSAVLDVAIERYGGYETLMVPNAPVEQRLVHVDDLVAATIHLMEHDDAVGRVFNVTSGQYPTSHEIGRILAAEIGMEMELCDEGADDDCGPSYEERGEIRDRMLDEGMKGDIFFTEQRFRFMRKQNRNNRLSIDALLDTGFEFRETDLEASIVDTITWYRSHRWVL
ncbi:MAG TPA: NAD(P)-dependent oxidoreductase [Acidimicrobiales bacterium]|nr:NAD(P)-dependent oxidoreductase [Acidimicrobiales bacterium]